MNPCSFRLRCVRYRLLLRGNTIRIDHKDNPVFLYDMDAYDPDNILEGLLRNGAHLKVSTAY